MTIVPLLEEEEEDGDSAIKPKFDLTTYEPDDRLVIPFQNENLYAYVESRGTKKVRIDR